jgi:hypothetical protein
MVPWQMKRLLSYDFDSFGESRSDPELQVLAEEEQGKRAAISTPPSTHFRDLNMAP